MKETRNDWVDEIDFAEDAGDNVDIAEFTFRPDKPNDTFWSPEIVVEVEESRGYSGGCSHYIHVTLGVEELKAIKAWCERAIMFLDNRSKKEAAGG